MASPLTHFLAGAALALPFTSRWTAVAVAGTVAVAPDLDFLLPWLLPFEMGNFFGHRGIFHAPALLAAAVSLAAWRWCGRDWRPLAIAWSLAAASHGVLDAFTDHGPGVMLLFPLTTARYFFPWRPIHATPTDFGLFLERAGRIFASEAPFAAVVVAAGALARGLRRRLS